jgi:hypothetical protein
LTGFVQVRGKGHTRDAIFLDYNEKQKARAMQQAIVRNMQNKNSNGKIRLNLVFSLEMSHPEFLRLRIVAYCPTVQTVEISI